MSQNGKREQFCHIVGKGKQFCHIVGKGKQFCYRVERETSFVTEWEKRIVLSQTSEDYCPNPDKRNYDLRPEVLYRTKTIHKHLQVYESDERANKASNANKFQCYQPSTHFMLKYKHVKLVCTKFMVDKIFQGHIVEY